MHTRSRLILLLLGCFLPVQILCAQDSAPVSPKKGWGDFEVIEETEPSPFRKALLWIPNRILDFIDIFRVDVGIGPSAGATIKITEHVNLSYRDMMPLSVRVGDFGRDWPIMIEDSDDITFSKNSTKSADRTVCPGEVGAGVELGIAGIYAGVCVGEIVDFIGGIFTFDFKNDDYH